MKHCLTIAGSDSSGGAGIQADLKTFSALGTFGMSVITAVTAQNTQGVFHVQNLSAESVKKQIEVLFEDIQIDGIKIGMVSQTHIINTIANTLSQFNSLPPIVLDPVMISKSGYNLLEPDAQESLIKNLLPLATLITPNLPEAESILGYKITDLETMKKACKDLKKLGPKYVLIKGGHLSHDATDVLFDGEAFTVYPSKKIDCIHTHGTGCTLSSAITANMSKGLDVKSSMAHAKKYITTAIQHGLSIGHGVGPTHHFYELYEKGGYYNE